MKRRFVNLVLGTWKNDTFTMHGIRSSSLFNPKKQIKGERPLPPTSLVEAKLPKPASTFDLSTPDLGDGWRIMFVPYGCNGDKIVSADQEGKVLVHDICQKKLSSMPRLRGWTPNSIAINLDDALYLIDRCPYKPDQFRQPYQRPCFQALINGEPPADAVAFPGWFWHTLPLPPYVEAPGYVPSCHSEIGSSTVVGDSIWVSARGGIGTYPFSTTSRTWSKVGGWELPFCGLAEYVPELDRWLGFSAGRENLLCATDLSAAAAANGAAPTLCRVWKEDLATNPVNWELLRSDLVRVDSGRFCIARLFHGYVEFPFNIGENFVVLTGVELERSDTADGGIQMVKHKSIRYRVDGKLIHLIC